MNELHSETFVSRADSGPHPESISYAKEYALQKAFISLGKSIQPKKVFLIALRETKEPLGFDQRPCLPGDEVWADRIRFTIYFEEVEPPQKDNRYGITLCLKRAADSIMRLFSIFSKESK